MTAASKEVHPDAVVHAPAADSLSDGEYSWDASAEAWINEMGSSGDFSRRSVLDGPMMARVKGGRFARAVDVGCGEGRFVRLLKASGVSAVGAEPTKALFAAAQQADPDGEYVCCRAESLTLPDKSVDLVIGYMVLNSVPGMEEAVREMARVVRPGGSVLVANLQSFNTAGRWMQEQEGKAQRLAFRIDDYATCRALPIAWRDMRIVTHHRPLEKYMQAFMKAGLVLKHFEEPVPREAAPEVLAQYQCAPLFWIMEWRKPYK